MKILKTLILLSLAYTLASCGSEKGNARPGENDPGSSGSSSILKVDEVIGIGKIEPETRLLSLATERSGIVTNVLKGNGDHVTKGEELIILDSETERINMAMTAARVKTQEYQVELMKNTVTEAEARLNNKKQLLLSSAELVKNGAETSQNLDDLRTEVTLLEISLENSRINLLADQSRLSELRSDLSSARLELGKRRLVSPFDGTVLDMKATVGSALNQYSVFTEFAPDGNIIARCEIDEMFSNKIIPGQEAVITLVGSTETIASGKVIRTAPFLKRKSLFSEQPGDREDRRVREVWILLDNPENLLFNMQVECKIKL